MTLATSLQTAASSLISKFGNTGTRYAFASATKTTASEGGESITSWGTSTSIKVVDGNGIPSQLLSLAQGLENVGSDDKIIAYNSTIAVNDRLTVNSVEYKVIEVTPIRTQDTVVAQAIKIEKRNQTTDW